MDAQVRLDRLVRVLERGRGRHRRLAACRWRLGREITEEAARRGGGRRSVCFRRSRGDLMLENLGASDEAEEQDTRQPRRPPDHVPLRLFHGERSSCGSSITTSFACFSPYKVVVVS